MTVIDLPRPLCGVIVGPRFNIQETQIRRARGALQIVKLRMLPLSGHPGRIEGSEEKQFVSQTGKISAEFRIEFVLGLVQQIAAQIKDLTLDAKGVVAKQKIVT